MYVALFIEKKHIRLEILVQDTVATYKLPDDPLHKFASRLQTKSSRIEVFTINQHKLKPIATSTLHCNDNAVVHVMIDFHLL